MLTLALCAFLFSACRTEDSADRLTATSETVSENPPNAGQEQKLEVNFSFTPEEVQPGANTIVTLRLPEVISGNRELEPIAGRNMHLIVVTRDLLWWKDLHPNERRRGEFAAEIELSAAKEYVAYALFRPAGSPHQVSKAHLSEKGGVKLETEKPLPDPLRLEPTPAERVSGRYRVALKMDPNPPKAGEWTTLTFHLTRGGEPVTNLKPLDALGHLIVIREGGEDFVYAHSTEGEALGGVRAKMHASAVPEKIGSPTEIHDSHGPDVSFHTQFTKPGLYRVWADFTPAEDRVRVDFVINVK